MSETHKRVGNAIAWVDLEPSNSHSESVGSAIVSYLQNLPECPDDSPTDDERGGWKVWALDRADEAIAAMGKAAIEEWYRGANRRGEPTEPVSDRLRTILNEADPHSTCEEAADLLDAQTARIAELEAEVERRGKLLSMADAICEKDPDWVPWDKLPSEADPDSDQRRLTHGFNGWFLIREAIENDAISDDEISAKMRIWEQSNAIHFPPAFERLKILSQIEQAAGDEDPITLIEAARKLPRDADGDIIQIDEHRYAFVRGHYKPQRVYLTIHDEEWTLVGVGPYLDEKVYSHPSRGYKTCEAAEAAKGVGDEQYPVDG